MQNLLHLRAKPAWSSSLYKWFLFFPPCCHEQELSQYRTDVENLVAEKNDLSLSFLHHSLPSDQDDDMCKALSNQVFHRDEKSSQIFTFTNS